ncbi:hypothetical protein L7F22_047271 [Adiantum nelumboides]|nr:hypothetical protein [Adiantum nelumboides]
MVNKAEEIGNKRVTISVLGVAVEFFGMALVEFSHGIGIQNFGHELAVKVWTADSKMQTEERWRNVMLEKYLGILSSGDNHFQDIIASSADVIIERTQHEVNFAWRVRLGVKSHYYEYKGARVDVCSIHVCERRRTLSVMEKKGERLFAISKGQQVVGMQEFVFEPMTHTRSMKVAMEELLQLQQIDEPVELDSDESDSERYQGIGDSAIAAFDPNKEETQVEEGKLAKMLAKDLTQEEREAYLAMLEGYPKLFIDGYDQIARASMVQHHINLKEGAKPMVQRLQRLGVIQQDALLSKVRKPLNARFIYPVEDSDWVSPIVVTPKKNSKWRVCVDYKLLNAATKRDHFPLPFQDEIFNKVADYERLQSLGGHLNVDKCHIAESQVTLLGHVVSSRGIEADLGKVQDLVGLPSPKSAKELVCFIQKIRYLRFIHLLSQVVLPLQQLTHSNTFSWSEENEQQFNEIKDVLSSLPTIAPPRWEETLFVNPSVGSDSIGVVLMQKDGETSFMQPIYFVSRVMTPLEKDYTVIEQMVMALMFAVGRFRSYLLPRKFVILTVEDTFPLVLQHMDVSARISKLLVRLQEFKYTVLVESSMRASLASMLTHRCYGRKVMVKSPGPKPVEVQAKLSGTHSLYFDGAYKMEVEKASVGISIQDENGHKMFEKGLLVENTHSNNEAEYVALALGLEWCVSMGIKWLNVFGDALLLIKHVHGTWACRNQSLVPRLRRVKDLIKRFEAIQLYHIPRKEN